MQILASCCCRSSVIWMKYGCQQRLDCQNVLLSLSTSTCGAFPSASLDTSTLYAVPQSVGNFGSSFPPKTVLALTGSA